MDINNLRGKEWDSINKAVSDVVLGKKQEEQDVVEEEQDTTDEPQDLQEGRDEEYEKFFKSALKKFGVKSPADLKDDQKKKFYDYVDKNWKGEGEKKEEVEEEYGAGEDGTDELLDTYKKETPGQTHMRWAGSQSFQKEEVEEVDERKNSPTMFGSGIASTYEFPDNKQAKLFLMRISKAEVAKGKVSGNKVINVELLPEKGRSGKHLQLTVAKFMKQYKGKIIKESVEVYFSAEELSHFEEIMELSDNEE